MPADDLQDMTHALHESEERFRAVLETAVNPIIVMGEDRLIRLVNTATETLFGYSKAEMLGQNVKMLMPPPYRDEHDGYVDNYQTSQEKKIIGIGREVVAQRKDGSTFPIHLSVGEAELAEGRLFTGIILDLSQQKSLEHKLLDVSEAEQRRIGRDLHDDICQQLGGIACLLEVLKGQWKKEHPFANDTLNEIQSMVRDTNAKTREIARGLVPVMLESEGLSAALRELASSSSHLFGIDCHLIAAENAGSNIAEMTSCIHLFRIAQEAIRNAVTHGKADSVELRLEDDNQHSTLTISDNGVGFDPNKKRSGPGMGLITMEHRTKMIAGRIKIERNPDRGTIIRCEIPHR